jgi:hypothetical protein
MTCAVVFTAYRKPPARRRFNALALFLAALVALGVTLLVKATEGRHQVVTRHGIKTIAHGMTVAQVDAVMGRPMMVAEVDGRSCYRYGTPTMEAPSFTVYENCFENGKLVSTRELRFSASEIESADEP